MPWHLDLLSYSYECRYKYTNHFGPIVLSVPSGYDPAELRSKALVSNPGDEIFIKEK